MDLLHALILGAVQGLTEFIPVSSTAHLLLAAEVLPIAIPPEEQWHAFVTIIQIGTLLPVLFYFRADWYRMALATWRVISRRKVSKELDERLALYLMIGTLPAAVIGLLAERHVERLAHLEDEPVGLLVIGVALLGFGLVMLWVDNWSRRVRSTEHLVGLDAWLIGLAQALALIPGVSRSGATITAGLALGLTREAAARFSFLLFAPVMGGATAWKLFNLVRSEHGVAESDWLAMAVATAAAAVVGYVCIAFLLAWLRRRSLAVFVSWRVMVGAFLILLYFTQQ